MRPKSAVLCGTRLDRKTMVILERRIIIEVSRGDPSVPRRRKIHLRSGSDREEGGGRAVRGVLVTQSSTAIIQNVVKVSSLLTALLCALHVVDTEVVI